jgi:hypothetical protein
VYGDRTITCVFEDGVRFDFPFEAVQEQLTVQPVVCCCEMGAPTLVDIDSGPERDPFPNLGQAATEPVMQQISRGKVCPEATSVVSSACE